VESGAIGSANTPLEHREKRSVPNTIWRLIERLVEPLQQLEMLEE
jgi:hypothetical protein